LNFLKHELCVALSHSKKLVSLMKFLILRFIRTLKENLLWVRTFDTIEELRAGLVDFASHYNETWLVARHGNRTPAQVRADQCRLDQNAIADLKFAA
jgi:putative transposase